MHMFVVCGVYPNTILSLWMRFNTKLSTEEFRILKNDYEEKTIACVTLPCRYLNISGIRICGMLLIQLPWTKGSITIEFHLAECACSRYSMFELRCLVDSIESVFNQSDGH